MKHICLFQPSSDLYGSDKIFLNILSCCYDYSVTVIVRTDGPLLEHIKAFKNVEIVVLPKLPILAKKYLSFKGFFMLLLNLAIFLQKVYQLKLRRFDIVYINTIAICPVLLYLSKHQKKIIHLHETIDTNHIFYKAIARFILHQADYVVCVSQAVLNPLSRVAGKFKFKLRLIYNGIPDIGLTYNDEKSDCIEQDKIHFALIGRIKPSMKGQNYLVEAVKLLSAELSEKAQFHIVGSAVKGQEYMVDDLNKLIASYNLAQTIQVEPFVENIASVYSKTDVVLVPSLCEDSLPTTVLEAMAFGKPVVATISGGIPEMVVDKETGFLIEKNNIEEFKNILSKLIANKEICCTIGKSARMRYLEKFTLDRFKQQMRIFLESLK